MFISSCSFGSTGSSAVSDYLRECEGVHVVDAFEFTISHAVDGLQDLEYFVMKRPSRQSSSIVAIQRFERIIHKHTKRWCASTGISEQRIQQITEEFLNSITQVSYVGLSPRINRKDGEFLHRKIGDGLIRRRIIPKLERKGIIKENFDFYPLERVRMSVKPPNFYEAAQKFTSDLLTGMGVDLNGIVVMDQALSGPNPAAGFPFFKDPYAVVADRDPRDLYIFAKKKLLSDGRFMPTDTVDTFINYYRLLRDGQPYLQDNPRILRIHFESLVYDYEKTAAQINAFLHVKNIKPKSVFKPERSAANTNLAAKFPELANDIIRIEKELPEYLFHFEDYPEIKSNGKWFSNRAQRPK